MKATQKSLDGTIVVRHRGTLAIVSSGYADRYVQSLVWTELVVDGITYRVSHGPEAARAYLRLAQMEETEEHIKTAIKQVIAAPYIMHTTAHTTTGTVTFETTSDRLRVGIAQCTGQPLTSDDAALAATLTENEWTAIQTGLERINREHARLGRQTVVMATR